MHSTSQRTILNVPHFLSGMLEGIKQRKILQFEGKSRQIRLLMNHKRIKFLHRIGRATLSSYPLVTTILIKRIFSLQKFFVSSGVSLRSSHYHHMGIILKASHNWKICLGLCNVTLHKTCKRIVEAKKQTD